MAHSSMTMTAMCLLVVATTASSAAAQSSGNMNFLTPVTGLPHLAKPGAPGSHWCPCNNAYMTLRGSAQDGLSCTKASELQIAEPTDLDLGTHGRFLLGGGKGKYVAPSKSAWKVKGSPKRKTAEVFKQVRHPMLHVHVSTMVHM